MERAKVLTFMGLCLWVSYTLPYNRRGVSCWLNTFFTSYSFTKARNISGDYRQTLNSQNQRYLKFVVESGSF